MNIPAWVWVATLCGLALLLIFDLAIIGRRPHEPTIRESALWVAFYVGLAGLFALGIYLTSGGVYATEFVSGWVTEYSLSVDNLFVFVIIMGKFAVPRIYQQKVLMIGIILALIMRGAFIAVGAAVVSRFVWVFYLFGLFLIYTAIQLVRHKEDDDDVKENLMIRWARRVLPVSKDFDGARMTTRLNGKKFVTPMLIVMIAIGTTDLMFAVDSIPAIFGLTQEPYLVFTANVFALMGLRQLYFLLGGLLDRLVYLSLGLAVVLGFIGVKLLFHAMHENNLPFLNGGEHMSWAPDISTNLSLVVIVGVLAVATVASLIKSRGAVETPAPAAPVATEAVESEADAPGKARGATGGSSARGAIPEPNRPQ
ncbi:tellurium resistance protein TerC [Actinorhabdospora filicis]|uniref:Tellurium resistance protein TerC n=1 Tax=Actinorhabdospora filicis TaxID=1785913 RepID=A0A9W6SL29_9ACTN|nr:tellurium resistance protein TerC [Actinorhabdospora filicis]